MPGVGRRYEYGFPNGTPWPMKIMTIGFFANLAGLLAVDFWAEKYAPRKPTVTSPFPIHFRGGVDGFLPSWLGHYEYWGCWLQFVLFVLIGLMLWWYTRTGKAVRVR
jgi:hypothetical protein